MGWADVPDSDWGDFRRRRAVDISSFTCDWGPKKSVNLLDHRLADGSRAQSLINASFFPYIFLIEYHYCISFYLQLCLTGILPGPSWSPTPRSWWSRRSGLSLAQGCPPPTPSPRRALCHLMAHLLKINKFNQVWCTVVEKTLPQNCLPPLPIFR